MRVRGDGPGVDGDRWILGRCRCVQERTGARSLELRSFCLSGSATELGLSEALRSNEGVGFGTFPSLSISCRILGATSLAASRATVPCVWGAVKVREGF